MTEECASYQSVRYCASLSSTTEAIEKPFQEQEPKIRQNEFC